MRFIKLLPALAVAATLSACVSNGNGYNSGIQNNAAVRTVGGAVAGALIADATGGSGTKGALVGAVVGGGSCALTSGCY